MPTTAVGLVDALEALTLTGVSKKLQGPPNSLNGATLPTAWVHNAEITISPFSRGTTGNWPTLKSDLVVAIGPVAQSTQSTNFNAAVAMCDVIAAALASTAGSALSKMAPMARIRTERIEVDGTLYWAAVASIEGQG